MAVLENFLLWVEIFIIWLFLSHDTTLGGAKDLGQKALLLAAGAVFVPKKAQNLPKSAKIIIFLKSEQIFLASENFSVGFFEKNILGTS